MADDDLKEFWFFYEIFSADELIGASEIIKVKDKAFVLAQDTAKIRWIDGGRKFRYLEGKHGMKDDRHELRLHEDSPSER